VQNGHILFVSLGQQVTATNCLQNWPSHKNYVDVNLKEKNVTENEMVLVVGLMFTKLYFFALNDSV